jgi:hypothetical protein
MTTDATRRGFLVMAGAGAAAVGVAAVVPAGALKGEAAADHPPTEGTLVAYVGDAADGNISLLVGDREVVVHDRDLVARLARAAS